MTENDSTPPPSGRLAGIDFGTVRIGVAMSDSRQTLASPYENYQRRKLADDGEYFKRLAREERVAKFIVGLPIHTHGGESQKSKEARAFGKWLGDITGVPVEFFDERYTSSEAEQHLMSASLSKKKRKARLDMLAAQIMLTAYLESATRGAQAPQALDD